MAGAGYDQKEINIGVAQGSILGPILFNIYINDLVNSSNDCKFFMFADDLNIIVEGKDCLHLEQNIKRNLSKTYEWLKANRIKANISKSKLLCLNCKITNEIYIGSSKIDFVNKLKYLGVIIKKT